MSRIRLVSMLLLPLVCVVVRSAKQFQSSVHAWKSAVTAVTWSPVVACSRLSQRQRGRHGRRWSCATTVERATTLSMEVIIKPRPSELQPCAMTVGLVFKVTVKYARFCLTSRAKTRSRVKLHRNLTSTFHVVHSFIHSFTTRLEWRYHSENQFKGTV